MQDLEQRIKQIEDRNLRVESDKDWEKSWTRRILLIIFTYLSIGLYLRVINVSNPWINAIVPAIGFMISTLTMPYFKKMWLKNRNK
ncbi:MAG: hypothetical protein WCJ57_01705 [Candidatus Falkowbacteria bacterium]